MRIGLVAPPWVPVPPTGYGGTELVIDCLARGLADLGHDVELFTLGESTCPVARSSLYASASPAMGTSLEEAAHVLAAYDALRDVEVIHDHTLLGPLIAAANGWTGANVITHHGTFSPEYRRVFAATARHAQVVAISHSQAAGADTVPVAAVIHHGIDVEAQQPGDGKGGYAMFLGRMSPDKGVDRAVRIAHAAGLPIVIAAKMREPAEQEFFQREVRPLLAAEDTLLIEPPAARRRDLLASAVALIDPISWCEPFGLVMIEALAAGTPVLGFPNGAAPEIVDDGVTGYLRHDEPGLVAALRDVSAIDRAACRRSAEQRFSMHRMALDHVAVYRRAVGQASARHRGHAWRIGHATRTEPHLLAPGA